MSRPSKAPHQPPPPPLTHRVPVAALDREAGSENRLRLSPDAEARVRIARFLEIEALEKLTLTASLLPRDKGAWELKGQLTATVVQSCVVTLEPVRANIDVPVRRDYLPAGSAPSPDDQEQELDEDDLEPPEIFEDHVDIGQLAVETLALSLDPWPRVEGARLENPADPRLQALEEDRGRPFASLAELREKLSRSKQ